MVDKYPWFHRSEADYNLLTRRYVCECPSPMSSCSSVEIDIVRKGVGGGVHQCQLDIVVLVDHDHRAGYGP